MVAIKEKGTIWTAHYHSWWYLTQHTGGIVYKCDCSAIKEPRAWWKFWQPRYIVKNPYEKKGL